MKRVQDTLYDILDAYTGESVTYNKVTKLPNGNNITDGDCDGVIYRKLNNEYFERVCEQINILWYGAIPNNLEQSASIQRAFNNKSKKSIFIPEGTFFCKNILITQSNINITGVGTLKIFPTAVIGDSLLYFTNCTNVLIENITLDGNKENSVGSEAAGINLLKAWDNISYLDIVKVKFQNSAYLGVNLSNCQHINVNRCSFINTDSAVTTFGGCNYISVTDNFAEGGTSDGFVAWGNPAYKTSDIIITGNRVYNKPNGNGVSLKWARNFVVTNNTVVACGVGIGSEYIQDCCEAGTINANKVENCNVGIRGMYNNVIISSNIVKNTTLSGIFIGRFGDISFICKDLLIEGNSVINYNSSVSTTDGDGIRVFNTKDSIIQNNKVHDIKDVKTGYIGIRAAVTSERVQILGNTVIGAVLDEIRADSGCDDILFLNNTGTINNLATNSIVENNYKSLYSSNLTVGSSTIVLNTSGDLYFINVSQVTLTITTISGVAWKGRKIILIIDRSDVTFNSTQNIRIQNSSFFTGEANVKLSLVFDGANWLEISRSSATRIATASLEGLLSLTDQTIVGNKGFVNDIFPTTTGTRNNGRSSNYWNTTFTNAIQTTTIAAKSSGLGFYNSTFASLWASFLTNGKFLIGGSSTDNGNNLLQVQGSLTSLGTRYSINITPKISDYTLTINDHTIICNVSTGSIILTLPSASTAYSVGTGASTGVGQVFIIKKLDNSVNTVTIQIDGVELIDGGTNYVLSNQFQTVTLQSNGTSYSIIGKV